MTCLAKLDVDEGSIVDGENIPVCLDVAYAIRGPDLDAALQEVKALHGSDVRLLPMSGRSGGGGVFQVEDRAGGLVVGMQFPPTPQPKVRRSSVYDITAVGLDQIVIDEQAKQICAGSSVTLDQLNRALIEELDARFKVLGADLTSYTYAQVGATFMTGGMGPQRRYFSDSVDAIALHDGDTPLRVEGEALSGYAGTYGWSGLVSAVRCNYRQLPATEIAFAIPVNNTPAGLARMLEHFAPYAYLNLREEVVVTMSDGTDLILGVEHITAASMGPLFEKNPGGNIATQARQLVDNCTAADAEGLLFVNGFSNRSADEFLLQLVDDPGADRPTIAGVDLEHTVIFNDPEEMRAIREGIPAAARAQSPGGRYVYKGHTDANVRLGPQAVEQGMIELWEANQAYVATMESYFDTTSGVNGEILVYGHLNPVGVDPHNRLTFACEDENIYLDARGFAHEQRDRFFRSLCSLCDLTGATLVGGEKGACSEAEIFSALGGPDKAPAALFQKFQRQKETIGAASPMFNWRAIAPYL